MVLSILISALLHLPPSAPLPPLCAIVAVTSFILMPAPGLSTVLPDHPALFAIFYSTRHGGVQDNSSSRTGATTIVSSARHAGNGVKLSNPTVSSSSSSSKQHHPRHHPKSIAITGPSLSSAASSFSPPLPSPNHRREQELQDHIACADIQPRGLYPRTAQSLAPPPPHHQHQQQPSPAHSTRADPFLAEGSRTTRLLSAAPSNRSGNLTRHPLGRGHQAHFAASDTESDEEIRQIFPATSEHASPTKQRPASTRARTSTSRRKHVLTPEAALFVGDAFSYLDTSREDEPPPSVTDSTALVARAIPVSEHRRRRVRTQDYVDSEESDAEPVGHHRRDGYLDSYSSSYEWSDKYSDNEDDSAECSSQHYYSSDDSHDHDHDDDESVLSFTSRASTFNADEGAIVFPAPYQFRCDCYQRELADRFSYAYNSSTDADSLDYGCGSDDDADLYSLQEFGAQDSTRAFYHTAHHDNPHPSLLLLHGGMNGGTPAADGGAAGLEAGMTRRRSGHTSGSMHQAKRRTLRRRLRPWMRRARHIVKHTEWFRTVASALYLFCVSLAMTLLQQVSDTRWLEHRPNQQVLYDTGFVLVNDISEHWLPDFFVLSLLGMTVIGVLWFCPTWPARQIVIRRLFWLTGSLYLYRAMTISVTTLPPPRPCNPVLITGIPALEVLENGIRMVTGGAISCTDNIFSGHTMILTSCALHWRIYVRRKYIAYYVYLHVIAGIYTIIGTHMHYTVDIILAIFITYGMYAIYFCVIRLAMERHRWAVEEHRATGGKLWEKDDQEYQRVAYTPRMLNSGMIRVIVWMDGLDLRWRPDGSADDGMGHTAGGSSRRRSSRRSRVDTAASQPAADIALTSIANGSSQHHPAQGGPALALVSVANPPAGVGYIPEMASSEHGTAAATATIATMAADESRLTGQRHVYPDVHAVDPVLGTNLDEVSEHGPPRDGDDSSDDEDVPAHGHPPSTTAATANHTAMTQV
ncbi:hypothetical protein SYNPS1DRAFT_27372 [Syncephalis pseudoplumigaleata]|uniref:Sphingomyelin synthase-like domain-containing protein n=1 Tax=Syncephalis pseudoplumigaleata TaxID=1712513 RepID=A0A4P9Z3J4_9FUNG|nr:hypothetical protein SYNPS1DRAFT_27372 [Syncephalis pseudoplumigaleata]|eukprot:RKP26958.1 hypothetical protein SYNPS1DRAFT_27372 [Syncephalis pseudoplumigaleata]